MLTYFLSVTYKIHFEVLALFILYFLLRAELV